MSDKHRTENELPLSLSLSGTTSGLRIALEVELLILSDTMRGQNEIYKVRTGKYSAE